MQEKSLIRMTIIISMLLLTLTSCISKNQSMEIEKLDNTLDIISMVLYNDDLYVGTTRGLYILDKHKELVEIELDYQIGFIYELYVHEKYGLFIGGLNGLIIMDQDMNQDYYSDDFLPDKRVYSINTNNEGHIFIGTFNGLLVLDDNLRPLNKDYQLLSERIDLIGFDNKGNSFISSYNIRSGGLTIIEGGVSTFYDNKSQLSTINSTSMVIDEQLFFIGGGMYETGGFDKFVYTNEGYQLTKSFGEADGLAGPKVRSMLLIGQNLFVGSEYDGFSILKFDSTFEIVESYKIFTTKNGLSHNEIKCMIEFEEFIYFGTKVGLSRMKNNIY